ncbi:hypothetical protein FQR65_LT03263 [Abscondita terminalis]|nr:hypothetical protein FQR65_LT03263 [Abscondita terminalis]
MWDRFRELGKTYYPIYKYYHLSIPVVNIICPEDMKIIMSSSMHMTKSEIYYALEPWLGTGLLTSTGQKWLHRRKLLTPSFHFNILQQFVSVFNKHTEALIKRLDIECSKPTTDVVPLVTETTLQSICETAMGTPLEASSKASQYYMKSVYRIGELIVNILTSPLYQIYVLFICTPTFWEFRNLVNGLHKFSTTVIKKRKEQFEDTQVKSKRMALLDMLIATQKSDHNIDDEGIREEVDTFMFEGHDTTTSCICFSLLLLACHSEIQNKVLDELYDIFGDSERMPTFEDLQNMRYLEQVLKECLRMYPSVPFISRVAEEDVQTSTNYTIPKGTIIQLHIYDLHHSEEIYPEPEKFDPERFSAENSKERHPYAYIPFSAGPRNCIGQKFAFMEVKTIISTIVRNYELLPIDTPSSVKIRVHLILKTTDGIKIKFLKRKHKKTP